MVKKLKVVLDTNIYISSLLTAGTSRRITERALDQAFELFISQYILEEFYLSITGKLKYSKDEAKSLTKAIGLLAEIIDIPRELEVSELTDPKDNPIIETAIHAEADFLVTNDDRLLAVKEYQGLKIKTAAEFLSVLKKATIGR